MWKTALECSVRAYKSGVHRQCMEFTFPTLRDGVTVDPVMSPTGYPTSCIFLLRMERNRRSDSTIPCGLSHRGSRFEGDENRVRIGGAFGCRRLGRERRHRSVLNDSSVFILPNLVRSLLGGRRDMCLAVSSATDIGCHDLPCRHATR